MENKIITIQEKRDYTGNAERPPVGDFYANGEKYTCWDKVLYAAFKVGDTVQVEYTEKVNGTYINRNISKMSYPSQNIPQQSLVSSLHNSNEISVGQVMLSGIKYDVIMRVANG